MNFISSILLLMISFNVIIVVCQTSVSITTKQPNRTPVVSKCRRSYPISRVNTSKEMQGVPLEYFCDSNFLEIIDCTIKNIYISHDLLDSYIRSVFDLDKVKAATRKMCEKKLNSATRFCNIMAQECILHFIQDMPDEDSPIYCRVAPNKQCVFNKLAKCDLQRAMLFSKYHLQMESVGCFLTNHNMQLIPSYGPELKCYSSIKLGSIDNTDYTKIYEHYCKLFDYNEVSDCIEKVFSNVSSEELWENKKDYVKKVKEFAHDRYSLCRNLTALSNRKCFNLTYKPVVSLCQRMLFNPPGPTKYNVSDYVELYANCILLTYIPCNMNMGLLIYNNLMTYMK